MRERVEFAVLFMVVVMAVVLALSAPAGAETGVGLFLTRGQTNLGMSWSVPLTQSPSVPVLADGLVAGQSYGVGVAVPLTTISTPLLGALGLRPSAPFEQALEAVQVGGAVLTENMKSFDVGLYARVEAFRVKW